MRKRKGGGGREREMARNQKTREERQQRDRGPHESQKEGELGREGRRRGSSSSVASEKHGLKEGRDS